MPKGIGVRSLDEALAKTPPASRTGVFLGFTLRQQLVSAKRIEMKLYEAVENINCKVDIPTLDETWPIDCDHELGLEEWRFKPQ